MHNVSEYSYSWIVYLSKQEIEEAQEHKVKLSSIRNKLGQYGSSDVTLEQLREIYKILFREE